MIETLSPADLLRVESLLRQQGFEYELPSIEHFVSTVAIREKDEVKMAIAARPTVELYMFCDSFWETPGMRLAGLKQLHERMKENLKQLDYFDAHAWLPPQIARSFGRRLVNELNFVQSTWPCYTGFTGKVR